MKQSAVIYARQSSGSDDYSESVAVQIANCRKLARQQNIEILEIISDLNVSGKTYPAGWENLATADRAFQNWAANNSSGKMFRSGLGKVMKLLDHINCIIVDDMTRLYRPLSRSYLENAVNQSLIEHNVKIMQVKGGTLDLALFDQQLITMLKNQINDEQIAKQRQRSMEVFRKLRDNGIMPTGITAFALNYDRVSKHYTVDKEKSVVIKFIFDRIKARQPYSNIVKSINERWKHYFNGCFWNKTLYEIARKPIYAGYQFDSRGQLIPNLQGEAIISLEDFLDVQAIMREKSLQFAVHNCNTPRQTRHWLPLSGRLYCGNCGSKLVVVIEKNKISYRCRKGLLLNDPECRSSRIAMYCTKPHITGLLDAIQVVIGNALIAHKSRKDFPHLLKAYLENSFTQDEYEMLLRESDLKIKVYQEKILISNCNGNIELERKCVLRQTGFSINRLTRLRKKIVSENF